MKLQDRTCARLHTYVQGRTLFLLCWTAYAAAYIGRYNYSAVMGAIISEGVLSLSSAGAISTGYFILYATGQIVSGLISQKISPYTMIFAGLALSGGCNFGMAWLPSGVMPLLWAANGFFQAMVWPPIVRLFAECLPLAQQKKACVNISSTTPVGTLISYGLSAILLSVATWHTVFWGCGIVLLAAAILWLLGTAPLRSLTEIPALMDHEVTRQNCVAEEKRQNPFLVLAYTGLFWLIVPVVLHGALKDGVTSWVPSMLQSNFAVSPAFSAAVSMVLPLVNLSGAFAANWLDRHIFHNELKTAGALFVVACMTLLALPGAVSCNLPIAVVLLSVTTAAMLGVNTIFINVIPVQLGRDGGAAFLSGALNAITYAGAAAATWGVGAAADFWGWNAVFVLWFLMATAAILPLALCAKRWSGLAAEASERRP